MRTRSMILACLILVLFPMISNGEVWSYAGDFSITQNPNGAWSYGWRAAPDQPMVLYTDNAPDQLYGCDEDMWREDIQDACPCLGHNPHDDQVCVTPPHVAWLHPGPAQQSLARWTAPGSMQIELTVYFEMLDIGSDIIRVYENGSELFTRTLESQGQSAEFATVLLVEAGDVIDCAVDPISFHYNTTQLDFVVVSIPPTMVKTTSWGQIKHTYR
jgi:hypothetical protein